MFQESVKKCSIVIIKHKSPDFIFNRVTNLKGADTSWYELILTYTNWYELIWADTTLVLQPEYVSGEKCLGCLRQLGVWNLSTVQFLKSTKAQSCRKWICFSLRGKEVAGSVTMHQFRSLVRSIQSILHLSALPTDPKSRCIPIFYLSKETCSSSKYCIRFL